jgi:hypothetical protein
MRSISARAASASATSSLEVDDSSDACTRDVEPSF